MINNIKYMVFNWVKWEPKSMLYLFISVPAIVISPILFAYIPKALIDCIEKRVVISELVLIIAFYSVLIVIVNWASSFFQALLQGSSKIIRMKYAVLAFEKNLSLSYVYLESLKGQECNKRAMEFYKNDESAAQTFVENSLRVIVGVVGIVFSCVMLYQIDIYIICIIIITCALQGLAIGYSNKREKELKNTTIRIFTKFDYYYELSKETSASKDIRLYNYSDCFVFAIAKLVNQYEKMINKFLGYSQIETGTKALLNLIRELIAYCYLVYLVYIENLNISNFIFYFGIIMGFSNWLVGLVYSIANIQNNCNDCADFRKYIERENNEITDEAEKFFDDISMIEFKNVSFNYPNTEIATINNMSFKVRSGEKIAIVGGNGAGKTTMIKLLCGLYQATSGDILINNKNCKELSRNSYFSLFSIVFQDFYFLPMTIAENICATNKYDKEKLYLALEKAGILDKIVSLDSREQTLMIKDVNKDAVDFSGGEKQKLLLAKAIYKDAPILVLDEPSAALDPISENELYLKYNEVTNNKISFFISHRLSSTKFCDRILYVEDGQIVESGTHQELMNKKGKYFRMYQLQSFYYKESVVPIE